MFCHDLDDNLREMGVGDLAVPHTDAPVRRGILRPRRPPMARRLRPPARRSLRRRSHAISSRWSAGTSEPRGSRVMCAPRRASWMPDGGWRSDARDSAVSQALRPLPMREPRSENGGRVPWHVPVAFDDVPETGQHLDLVASAELRAGVARMAGLRDLPRLQASFDVTRHGSAATQCGAVCRRPSARPASSRLEPLANEVEEAIDLVFAPPSAIKRDGEGAGAEERNAAESWSEPEPLIDGTVDLGALATEFLILGLDPYPRKPGAVFQPPGGRHPPTKARSRLSLCSRKAVRHDAADRAALCPARRTLYSSPTGRRSPSLAAYRDAADKVDCVNVAKGPHCARCDGGRPWPGCGRRRRGTRAGAPSRQRIPVLRQQTGGRAAGAAAAGAASCLAPRPYRVAVRMEDKPSQALRYGRWKSSMWLAIDAVKKRRGRRRRVGRQYRRADGDGEIRSQDACRASSGRRSRRCGRRCAANRSCSTSAPRSGRMPSIWSISPSWAPPWRAFCSSSSGRPSGFSISASRR